MYRVAIRIENADGNIKVTVYPGLWFAVVGPVVAIVAVVGTGLVLIQ